MTTIRALFLLCILSLATLATAQTYTITDLGGGQAFAINSLGDVGVENNYNKSFVWGPGGSQLTLTPLFAGWPTVPNGINSQGLVAGLSANGQGYAAVLWTNGKPLDLGMLSGGRACAGAGINASGEVAGYCYIYAGAEAFVWTKATGMQGIGTLPGATFSFAQAINRFGQVAGYSGTSDNIGSGKDYAFIWSKTTGMTNLGKLPGYDGSAAYAINDLGDAAGASFCKPFSCPAHAVLWSKTKGSMLDLGVPPGANSSFAYSINNVGQVVGFSDVGAFVWSPSTGMLDLNSLIPANSGWVLTGATAINDAGQIVGYGTHTCCVTEAFLLTPQ
jgi:probable HAF family extracellular repeat protein